MRCVALAEELRSQGASVTFVGDVSQVPWAQRQLDERDFPVVPAAVDPAGLADQLRAAGTTHVVLDGYGIDPGTGAELRRAGLRVLALHDGPFGADQEADVYLDQNFAPVGSDDAVRLSGLDYVLLRDVVRQHRPDSGAEPVRHEPPRVLAVFGGTDPFGAAEVVVPLLLRTGRPCEVVVVAGDHDRAGRLAGLTTGPDQSVTVSPPLDDLAAAAVDCDLVMSAAGSATWEFMHLGVPTALVCVVDNQEMGYEAVVDAGYAARLGRLADLRARDDVATEAMAVLTALIDRDDLRAELRQRGMTAVDGRGRERVARVLLDTEQLELGAMG